MTVRRARGWQERAPSARALPSAAVATAGVGARSGTGGGRVRRTQHVLVWPRGGPDAPRADGDHGWGAPAGTAGDGALRVRVPRARAAVEAGWLAEGPAAARHGPARAAPRGA